VVLTFAGRWLVHRYGDGGEEHATLNTRSGHLVGRTGKVLDYNTGAGAIEVDGTRWRANWPSGEASAPGETVRVTAAEGMTLQVQKIQAANA
ncbi:MAG: NfeD family protein, partial [Pseudomonadota bacterium]